MDHLGLEHTTNWMGVGRSGYRGNDPDHPGTAVKDDLQVMVWSYHLERVEERRMGEKDQAYFSFAIMFCFCYTWFYTDSLFVSSVALFQIFMSVPITGFVWVVMLQINYFT